MAYRKRKFLNKTGHHSLASIFVEVTDIEKDKKNKWAHTPDVTFKISDCSRVLDLDFSMYTETEYKNSLYKIELLEGILAEFKDAFIEGHEEYLAEKKRVGDKS